jgi:hypothetical protein
MYKITELLQNNVLALLPIFAICLFLYIRYLDQRSPNFSLRFAKIFGWLAFTIIVGWLHFLKLNILIDVFSEFGNFDAGDVGTNLISIGLAMLLIVFVGFLTFLPIIAAKRLFWGSVLSGALSMVFTAVKIDGPALSTTDYVALAVINLLSVVVAIWAIFIERSNKQLVI